MKSINSIFQLINIQFINLILSYVEGQNHYKLNIQIIVKFAAKSQENKSRFVIKLL